MLAQYVPLASCGKTISVTASVAAIRLFMFNKKFANAPKVTNKKILLNVNFACMELILQASAANRNVSTH